MIFDPQKNEMFGAKTVSIFIIVMLGVYYVVWRLFLQGIDPSVQEDIASGNKVVLLFSAKWCGTCKKQKPTYEAAKREFKNIHFYNVMENMNRVQQKLLFQEYKIHGIPTLILYKEGKEFERLSGLQTQEELEKEFSKL